MSSSPSWQLPHALLPSSWCFLYPYLTAVVVYHIEEDVWRRGVLHHGSDTFSACIAYHIKQGPFFPNVTMTSRARYGEEFDLKLDMADYLQIEN